MDSRNDPNHYSWSRPQSQTTARDSNHQVPVQPPAYAPQLATGVPPPPPAPPSPATQRPRSYFSNDPFLSRSNDRIGSVLDLNASKPPLAVGNPFGVQQYATSMSPEASGPVSMQEQERNNQGVWQRLANGRDARNDPQITEGEWQCSLRPCAYVSRLSTSFLQGVGIILAVGQIFRLGHAALHHYSRFGLFKRHDLLFCAPVLLAMRFKQNPKLATLLYRASWQWQDQDLHPLNR